MVISDEAVEVVARWLWARDSNDIVEGPRPRWEDLPTAGIVWQSGIEDTRQEARELLGLAAPYLMAEAWDRAAASIIDERGNPIIPTNVDNPCRSQA